MAARVARHGAQRRTAGAANAFEAFVVAGGALSVVALMTVLAGGPAQVDGAVTGEQSDPDISQVVWPTSVGSGSGVPWSTTRPGSTRGPSSAVPPDASTTLPLGPPTAAPPMGLGPPSPLPVATTAPDTTAPGSAPTTDPETSTPESTPTTKPKPAHPSRPVTPGVAPTSPPRPTPRG